MFVGTDVTRRSQYDDKRGVRTRTGMMRVVLADEFGVLLHDLGIRKFVGAANVVDFAGSLCEDRRVGEVAQQVAECYGRRARKYPARRYHDGQVIDEIAYDFPGC